MQCKHIIKRGLRYYFVCRVPNDLLRHFPSPVIWKSLKTDNKKFAHIEGAAVEFKTQKLFLQLRTGMLDPNLEKLILAQYLNASIETFETEIGFNIRPDSDDKEYVAELREMEKEGINKEFMLNLTTALIDIIKLSIAHNRIPELLEDELAGIIDACKGDYRFSKEEAKTFKMKLLSARLQLSKVMKQAYEGDTEGLELLKEKVERNLAIKHVTLKDLIPEYLNAYKTSKNELANETFDKVEVECRVLLEILGNISIDRANTDDKLEELRKILKRYPKNKQQKFGQKSVHSILKGGFTGEVISPKTANNYIKRMALLVDFAIARLYLERANIYRLKGTLFPINNVPEFERPAYDKGDIERLVDAICTQNLWHYGEPKPERFWIILIAIFHGFRLGNITSLTKNDICKTDDGTWIFNLKHGKSKTTIRPVAIADSLLLLGFVDWINTLQREKLFLDSPATFSKWYNRKDGGYLGFESRYVTNDPKKCLYSVRHSFGGEVYSQTDDLKATSEMLGHSLGRNVTNRYIKLINIDRLKVYTDSIHQGIDLDKLDKRAEELFNLNECSISSDEQDQNS